MMILDIRVFNMCRKTVCLKYMDSIDDLGYDGFYVPEKISAVLIPRM